MDRNVFRALLATAGFLLMAMPVWAHHSAAAVFDTNNKVTLTGVITEVRLTNPHSWFYIDVTDESGKVTRWGFEGGLPSTLVRSGYKRDAVKVGDKVTIKGSRARDLSANMGLLESITTTDPEGRQVVVYGGER
jgi:hypothetical protein